MFKPLHVYNQEPITWSKQLPCAHAKAFLQTSLFLDQFSHEFWLHVSNKPYKSISKNWRLRNVFLMFWQTWVFALSFWCRYFCSIDGHKYEKVLLFSWEKYSKLMLKINWSVKTPLHEPSMRVACSRFWAPFLGFWVIKTGYWPVPFSLQIGGSFLQGQIWSKISTWKVFLLLKIYSLSKKAVLVQLLNYNKIKPPWLNFFILLFIS